MPACLGHPSPPLDVVLFVECYVSAFPTWPCQQLWIICELVIIESVMEVVSVRFETVLCSDTSSRSLILSWKSKYVSCKRCKVVKILTFIFLSFLNHAVNLLLGEMTLVVSNGDAVRLSGLESSQRCHWKGWHWSRQGQWQQSCWWFLWGKLLQFPSSWGGPSKRFLWVIWDEKSWSV